MAQSLYPLVNFLRDHVRNGGEDVEIAGYLPGRRVEIVKFNPLHVRDMRQDLEGLIRSNRTLRDENAALKAKIKQLEEQG